MFFKYIQILIDKYNIYIYIMMLESQVIIFCAVRNNRSLPISCVSKDWRKMERVLAYNGT